MFGASGKLQAGEITKTRDDEILKLGINDAYRDKGGYVPGGPHTPFDFATIKARLAGIYRDTAEKIIGIEIELDLLIRPVGVEHIDCKVAAPSQLLAQRRFESVGEFGIEPGDIPAADVARGAAGSIALLKHEAEPKVARQFDVDAQLREEHGFFALDEIRGRHVGPGRIEIVAHEGGIEFTLVVINAATGDQVDLFQNGNGRLAEDGIVAIA